MLRARPGLPVAARERGRHRAPGRSSLEWWASVAASPESSSTSHGQPLWGREVGAERSVCGQRRVMGSRRRARALDSRVSPNGGLCAHAEAAGSVGRSEPQGPALVGRGVGAGKWREETGPGARSFTPIRSFSFIEAGSWGQRRSSARNGVPPSETESRECNTIQC